MKRIEKEKSVASGVKVPNCSVIFDIGGYSFSASLVNVNMNWKQKQIFMCLCIADRVRAKIVRL